MGCGNSFLQALQLLRSNIRRTFQTRQNRMIDKDPDSNLGVGGRAMFWEGVFEVSSASVTENRAEMHTEAHPGEAVLNSYTYREVRPARERRSSRRESSVRK